jgi:hypothetical protein
MGIIKTSKQVVELYNRIISERLLDHTCQFFIKKPEGLRPYASGVFVVIHNVYFIFTASHVADILSNKICDLFIKIDNDEYINVIGRGKYTDSDKSKGIDLAYIKLDNQMIPHLIDNYKFLTIDKIRKHDRLLEGAANYCVLGFPENSFDNKNDYADTKAQAYFTFPMNDKPYGYYKLSKEDWIIVKITGKGQDVITKEKLPLNTHFYGLSGCGLWLMMPNVNDNSCDYRLIGIMTDYKKGKYFCLIGNKIHLLIQALSIFENMKFGINNNVK